MGLFIGVDGGGTKTDAVLVDESGAVLCRVIGAASNPISGMGTAQKNIARCLSTLLEAYGGLSASVETVYAGIAGTGHPKIHEEYRQMLKGLLPGAFRIENGSDAENDLIAVMGMEDGVVAIAGTGSSVHARKKGRLIRVGGWGYLFEDVCGAYQLGREALMATMKQKDGRGKATLISSFVQEKLRGDIADRLPSLYAMSVTEIADFAKCLTKAFDQGDELAQRILEEQANAMATCIRVASNHLNKETDKLFHVVLSGSLWTRVPFISGAVKKSLGEGYQLYQSNLPAVYGAARQAAMLSKLEAGEDFHQQFSKSIETAPTHHLD